MSKRSHSPPDHSPEILQDTTPAAGNTSKYSHVEKEMPSGSNTGRIICTLPPHRHPPLFSSAGEYELHYKKAHANRCLECHKNFPTDHYLNIHISENHDPLIATLKARGEKTFKCFVEHCDRVCSTAQKRRLHLIDKHLFPKNYDFFIVNDGLEGRRSLLRPRRPLHPTVLKDEKSEDFGTDDNPREENSEDSDSEQMGKTSLETSKIDVESFSSHSKATDDLEAITKSMASLKFVPNSVRFGRGRGKRGLARN